MLFREIFHILAIFFLLFGLVLLIPLAVAIGDKTAWDFLIAILLSLGIGGGLFTLGSRSTGIFYRREGIASVVLIWFLVPAISALPFLTSGTISNPFQAYFEMVSGYTTTGSTVLHAKNYNDSGHEIPWKFTVPGVLPTTYTYFGTVAPLRNQETGAILKEGVEAVSRPLLFWRSFTQWFGGVGIIVLYVALLPALGIGRKLLYQSEVTAENTEGATTRIKEAALQLLKIYFILTVLQIVLLMLTNHSLPFFEALLISFSTLSTGGFSTHTSSIGAYHHAATEWVVIAFMIIGSVNFSLYYFLFKGKFFRLYQPELLVFFAIVVILAGLVVYSIGGMPYSREGIFQLVSAQTSTGFFTKNYDVWPYAAQLLLLIAMYIGGMSGSTAGGIKIIRHIILFRSAQYRVESLFRPNQVRMFKVGSKEIGSNLALLVLSFFLIVMAFSAAGTLLYVYDGIDPETAFGLTACMLNNTGMSFRMAGPDYSCAFLSNFSLALSSFLMICGRLEYYAVLAILVPHFGDKTPN